MIGNKTEQDFVGAGPVCKEKNSSQNVVGQGPKWKKRDCYSISDDCI